RNLCARRSSARTNSLSSSDEGQILVLHSFPTRRSSDLDCDGPWSPEGRRPDVDEMHPSTGCRRELAEVGDRLLVVDRLLPQARGDRKSTRLNSSHLGISYAVFCLKKKTLLETSTVTCEP